MDLFGPPEAEVPMDRIGILCLICFVEAAIDARYRFQHPVCFGAQYPQ
jgi:hypothetical protein